MKMNEIKLHQRVTGYYLGDPYAVGIVIKKLKTVVYIDFDGELVKYDKAHLRFLTEVK